jgi:hypothetical protein
VEQFIRQAEEANQRKGTTAPPVPQTAVPPNLLPSANGWSNDPFARSGGVVTPGQPDAKAADAPVHKKWWFWTIIGVATAGIATGVGLGLAAREPDTTGLMEYRP